MTSLPCKSLSTFLHRPVPMAPRLPPNLGGSLGEGESSGCPLPAPGSSPAPRALQEHVSGETGFEEEFGHRSSVSGHTRAQPFFRLAAYPEIHLFLHTSLARFPLPSGAGDCSASQVEWEDTGAWGAQGSRGVGALSCQASLPCPPLRMGPSFPVSVTTLAPLCPLCPPKAPGVCPHATTVLSVTPNAEVPRGLAEVCTPMLTSLHRCAQTCTHRGPTSRGHKTQRQ